ncbi:hypothetical protein ACHAWF_012776 [Thalassiosira exigua]
MVHHFTPRISLHPISSNSSQPPGQASPHRSRATSRARAWREGRVGRRTGRETDGKAARRQSAAGRRSNFAMDKPMRSPTQSRWIAAAILVAQLTLSEAADRRHWYTAPTVGSDNVFAGNRILAPDARGGFPDDVESIDVDLPSDFEWIVATETRSGPQFVATTEDGPAYAATSGGGVRKLDYPKVAEGFDAERPPLVATSREGSTDIVELPPSAKLSSLSHPVPTFPCNGEKAVNECEIYTYIDEKGDHILYDNARQQRLDQVTNINALPDGRIVVAPTNAYDSTSTNSSLLAVYGGATSYSHCVLGDCLEGSSLLLIQVSRAAGGSTYSMTLERQITLPSGTVFEGLSPMFIKDGATIVTTVARSSIVASSLRGAWLRSYDVLCGDILSESSSIGWGWRHVVLFYNNFAPIESGGEPLYSLVDVLTPHVRKRLQFFDIDAGSSMEMRASTDRYTTHDIGWRYLDTALSGDFNGDGINEAVLLDEYLQNLVSFQLTNDGSSVEEVWSIPLAGKLSSNIAAVAYGDGTERRIALAAASGNTLRIWTSASPEGQGDAFSTLPTKSTTRMARTTSSTATGTSSTKTDESITSNSFATNATSPSILGVTASVSTATVVRTTTDATSTTDAKSDGPKNIVTATSLSTLATSTTPGAAALFSAVTSSTNAPAVLPPQKEPMSCSAKSKLGTGSRSLVAVLSLVLSFSWWR